MRVIIPAAGAGSRLAPFTDFAPKGLVPVCGKPLLWHTLRELRRSGADLAIVVCGHFAAQLRASLLSCPDRPRLEFVENENYAQTNSIVSLWLTRAWWDQDICIVDGDVLASRYLIRRLWDSNGNVLAVDRERPYSEIDMKVELANGCVRAFGKELPAERSAGEFFGVSRWTAAGARVLGDAISQRLERGGQHDWYEEAVCDATRVVPVGTVAATTAEWSEVDRPADLGAAERLVRDWVTADSEGAAPRSPSDTCPVTRDSQAGTQ